MDYTGTFCRVCGERVEEDYSCGCTRGKYGIASAIKALSETDLLTLQETQEIIDLIKTLDTPVINLDRKIELHPQLSASVASLKAKYFRLHKKAELELAVRREGLYLKKREEYVETRGQKTWKTYEKEVDLDKSILELQEKWDKFLAAYTFLDDLCRIMIKRGDSINKMSDDRRQLWRLDSTAHY